MTGKPRPRFLRTVEEVRAAGAAAVADWPPLTDHQLERLAVIFAPLGDPATPIDRRSSA